jgi:antitoxin (DNA-binding transcriptional repressor) of toxin-antitoxin stability system
MRTISPLDLRKSLGQILDQASAGELFLIERDHRPMAMLVSVEDGQRLDEDREERIKRSLEAIRRISARAEANRLKYPSDLSAVDAVRLDRDRDEPGAEDA